MTRSGKTCCFAERQSLVDGYSDEELCALARSGDKNAEQVLALRHHSTVRACVRPYFLAGGDSEDLIQEGMIGLLHAIREFTPAKDAAFRTFASRCIRNRLSNAVKAAGRLKHQPLCDYVPFADSEAADSSYACDPENEVLVREADRELASRLREALSPLEGRVLQLYLDGVSYQVIAETLGSPVKSVDNAVQRIRKKLCHKL